MDGGTAHRLCNIEFIIIIMSLSPIEAIAVRSNLSEALVLALDVLYLARVDRIVGVLIVQQCDGQLV